MYLASPREIVDESGIMVWDPSIEWTGGGLIPCAANLALQGEVKSADGPRRLLGFVNVAFVVAQCTDE